MADIDSVSKNWSRLGDEDPLWAVLTVPGMDGQGWDVQDFLATGVQEIEALFEELGGRGVDIERNSALDFGCGAGRLSQALAGIGFKNVVGIDISAGMLNKAKEINQHGDRVNYVHNQAPDLSVIPTDSVDFLYTSRVLQHMPSSLSHKYVGEFFRVTRPGGIVVFQIPSHPALNLGGLALRLIPTPVLNRLRKGMEMHGTPESQVRGLISTSGGTLLAVDTNNAAGDRWVSCRYISRVN